MTEKKKFYAVYKGRKPGIYTAWFGPGGAEEQVRGFRGAVFKGFPTRKEAEAFMTNPPKSWFSVKKQTQGPDEAKGGVAPGKGLNPEARGDGVVIYTDGSARHNPGPGGYGAVILNGKGRRELSGGFRRTTNNRMELLACIKGLEALDAPGNVDLYSDSSYVVNGITKGWARGWQKRGWKKSTGEPALNPDLWERLLSLCEVHSVQFHWVRGHAGNPENERCDALATRAADQPHLPADAVYESTRQMEPDPWR